MNETQTSPDGGFFTGCSSVHQNRSDSPDISCVSLKSDQSIDVLIKFSHGDTSPALSSVLQKRSVSPDISCVSMKSAKSIDVPLKFRTSPALREVLTEPVCRKLEHQSQDFNEDMCAGFSHKSKLTEVLNIFRSNLRQKFECLCEGTSQQRNPTLLNEIYTDLYITESESGEISNEHEVRQIETQSRRAATEDKPIKCSDIFKPLSAQDKPIRHVLTKGVAGIGKTVSVQKFILDWAEGKENQDVHLIFPLPFRELNLMKNKTLSLLDLLHLFFPETKEIEISRGEYKVLFIFDGLDECRLHLNVPNNQSLSDVNESASVDVMLTNLMAGNLLPAALIWTTSRPAAADLIPSECVDRVTEVRGFTDKQKEEYFSKRISDDCLNNRIISHLKSSRSLYSMCHIPVFCWISATVLERMFSEAESDGEIPKTLTQMYTHFLIIQTNIKHQKDYEKNDREMILKLGKLAFKQLVKGNVIFYDEDLRVCGIDVAEASVYSGLCTQIFREEFGLYRGKVYCFVHLSIQEHLAALYAHLSFINNNRNVFKPGFFPKIFDRIKKEIFLSELHQRAVDEALQRKDGHLDLFLRFLLGLSLESNQTLLRDLLTKMRRCSYKKEETVDYIKHKIKRNLSPEKSINLFHCLNELNDDSLLQKIQHYMTSRSVAQSKLSSSQWSALGFVLLMSEQHLEEFDLSTFVRGQNTADEVLVRLQPVIKESKKLELSWCSITAEGCVALASALRSHPSHLTDLNLSYNNLKDSGVKLMSTVLENPHCKLTSLRLCGCSITAEGCVALVSALRSNPSHLTHLNLSDNNLTDSGLKIISTLLENPQCKLEKLMLERCSITDGGCAALTSALKSNPSHLRELNLSDNSPGNSGVKLISNVLENPHCKLEKLELRKCNITDKGCVALSSALSSNPSHLRHLDLSDNYLMYSGVKLISTFLESPQCKLEKLDLRFCDIKDERRAVLDSAMRSNSHLSELYY